MGPFFTFLSVFQAFFIPLMAYEASLDDLSKGYHFLEMGNLKEAKRIFSVESHSPSILTALFAKLGFAKAALEESDYDLAEKLLDTFSKQELDLSLDLRYEWYLTQGDLYFRQSRLENSLRFLEMARPRRNFHLAPWGGRAFSLLGRAYLKKGEVESDHEVKLEAMQQAEKAYLELAEFYPDSQNPLEISRLYTAKARLLNDPKALQTGNQILNLLAESPNHDLRAHAFMILGDSAFNESAYLKAESYYEEASKYAAKGLSGELCLKQASSLIREGSLPSLEKSREILDSLEPSPPQILLKAESWIRLDDKDQAITLLKKIDLPSPYREEQLFLLGKLAFEMKDYAVAERTFLEGVEHSPESAQAPLFLYWAARAASSAEKDPQELYRKLYEQFPSHPLAAEAYFYTYTPEQYLLGNRAALKHLHQFRKKFPDAPIGLSALFLIGLDYLHDRKSPEGKQLSKMNLTAAIDAFQEVETLFDKLYRENKIEKGVLPQMIALRYQAILEKGKTNLSVARSAKPAKQRIFFDYAEDLFLSLIRDFESPSHPLLDPMRTEGIFHPIEEEALYYRALIQFNKNEIPKAKEAFSKLLDRYQKLGIREGYFLSRSFYQLGLILKEEGSHALAIQSLDQAREAGKSLSNDEIVDLLIEKSENYRLDGKLDAAMLQLSEAVNYQAVSSLRLKAMYLRAEIYALQGRPLLARKALESLANKEGEWAQKAKEKLEKEYGFD